MFLTSRILITSILAFISKKGGTNIPDMNKNKFLVCIEKFFTINLLIIKQK